MVHGCHPDDQLRLSTNNEINSATQSLQEDSNRLIVVAPITFPLVAAGVFSLAFAVVFLFCCIGNVPFHLKKKKQPYDPYEDMKTDPAMIRISSKETFSPFLKIETSDGMQLCSLLEMVNECPNFLKNIESIQSTCNGMENDDITYKIMHTNLDQAVFRETLLLQPRIKRNDTVRIGMHPKMYVLI